MAGVEKAVLDGDEWDSDSSNEGVENKSVGKLLGNSEGFVKIFNEKKEEAKNKKAVKTEVSNKRSSVIYLGRIPHGFYEKQMKAFFSQFGDVKRLRLSRNKKTGKSKHYAFIEFLSPDVAEIVAETMNGYRLFDVTLACNVLSRDKIHDRMFVGANRNFRAIPWTRLNKNKVNAERTPEAQKKRISKILKNERSKKKKLEALGIEYEFNGYAASVESKPKHTKFE